MNTFLDASVPVSLHPTAIHDLSFPGILPIQFDLPVGNKFRTSILSEPSRLPEIYELRLIAWERSSRKEVANRTLFPNGWYDDLDESAIHWISVDENDIIVASARLNIFNALERFPYYNAIQHIEMDPKGTFAFFSRLVVHPQFRKNGLGRALYQSRAAYCEEHDISWSQVFINDPHVIAMFESEGFENVGKASVSYHPSVAPHAVNVFVKKNKPRPMQVWNQPCIISGESQLLHEDSVCLLANDWSNMLSTQ